MALLKENGEPISSESEWLDFFQQKMKFPLESSEKYSKYLSKEGFDGEGLEGCIADPDMKENIGMPLGHYKKLKGFVKQFAPTAVTSTHISSTSTCHKTVDASQELPRVEPNKETDIDMYVELELFFLNSEKWRQIDVTVRSEIVECAKTKTSSLPVLPGTITKFDAKLTSPSAIHLKWEKPRDGGQVGGYNVMYWDKSDTVTTVNVNKDFYEAMIEDLDPLVKYKMKVQPYNAVGDGTASKVVEIKTPAAEDSVSNKTGEEVLMEGTDATNSANEKDEFCYEDENLAEWDKEYKMKKRGVFFIFVIKEDRKGAEMDIKNYNEIAELLGFTDIRVHENLTKNKIKDELHKYANENRDDDCVVCAIAAHGSINDIIKVCHGYLFLDDFVEHFSEKKCKFLKGKPKIIIVQACRGGIMEKTREQLQTTPSIHQVTTYTENLATNYCDLLLASSSIPDTTSLRCETDGSWYIRYLLEELKENSKAEICEILTKVNRKLSKMEFEVESECGKQMSCFRSNLTQKLYF